MSKKTPRLGRGLSTLITSRTTASATQTVTPAADDAIRKIPLEKIRPSQHQPRRSLDPVGIESLAASIRTTGLLQPVIVRESPSGDGEYELVAGERRWRAAMAAGLEAIPAIVRSADDAQSVEVALIENLQREDLNAVERAEAYHRYLQCFNATADDLARRLGESRATIANYIRILNLQDEVRRMVESGDLAMGQARAIAGIDDPQRQLAVARLAVRRNLAVRQVETLVKGDVPRPREDRPERVAAHQHQEYVERALSDAIGLRVHVLPGKKKNSGRVVIEYQNIEEFDRIAERVGGRKELE